MLKPTLCSFLFAVLPLGVLAIGCAPATSTTSQMITCTTDPGTGVILACVPGDGGGGGAHTCTDIDEDGDGEPRDTGEMVFASGSDSGDDDMDTESEDSDDDGIDDADDCDSHPGEDDNCDGDVDLPYDVRPKLGAMTTPVVDAFAEKGAQPAAIVSITGATWRLAELQAGTPFAVTPEDCAHAGNRDVGRDRVIVTWQNTDGSQQSDHLDIRYCD